MAAIYLHSIFSTEKQREPISLFSLQFPGVSCKLAQGDRHSATALDGASVPLVRLPAGYAVGVLVPRRACKQHQRAHLEKDFSLGFPGSGALKFHDAGRAQRYGNDFLLEKRDIVDMRTDTLGRVSEGLAGTLDMMRRRFTLTRDVLIHNSLIGSAGYDLSLQQGFHNTFLQPFGQRSQIHGWVDLF